MDPQRLTFSDACVVVVPCYNEAERLPTAQFDQFLTDNPELRFLFVNDGSKDRTLLVLEALRERHPAQVEVLDQKENQGKAQAVRAGLLAVCSSPNAPAYTGYWDADLATPLSELPRLLAILRSHSAVLILLGSRVRLMGRHIHRRPARHYSGRIFATVASLRLRLPIYDTQCGAKLLRVTSDLPEILEAPFRSKWAFDVELLARMLSSDSRTTAPEVFIYEEPLLEWRDVGGSKLTLRDSLKALVDLLQVRHPKQDARSGVPPRL